MNHYPRHVGDFAAATQGLTLVERGAYDALLDQYYVHEAPLPLDRSEIYRMAVATSTADRKAVDYVLGRYFDEQADGWHNKRADKEIARFHEKSEKARQSINTRWNERNTNVSGSPTNDGIRTYIEGNTNQNQNQNQKKSKGPSPSPDGFGRFWSAWPTHRRKAGRPQCLALWKSSGLEQKAERIVAHVEAMRRSVDWVKDEGAFVPAPLVYLRQERYDAPIEVAMVAERKVAL